MAVFINGLIYFDSPLPKVPSEEILLGVENLSSTVHAILFLCHLPLEYAQNPIITVNNISDSPSGMLFYYMPSHV